MRILALTRYGRVGASSRLRLMQYLPHLRAEGIKSDVAPFLGDDYLRRLYAGEKRPWGPILSAYLRRLAVLARCRRYDLLWIEYEIFPWLPPWAEQLLGHWKLPYAADYDDAVFHNYDQSPRRAARLLMGDKIDRVMKGAALVTAGNEYLAARARSAGAERVEIVPTVIDLNRYPPAPERPSHVFSIGWIGSPATARYLPTVQPALAQACAGVPARVVLVGSGPMDFGAVPTEIHEWTEAREVADVRSFDVGIMPLADNPWEKGKCSYKLIQYMACGKPVVASPVGHNMEVVQHGVNGYLAKTHDDWAQALTRLRVAPELRRRMGEAGRKRVESRYCLQVTAPRLAEWLREAAGTTR
ncbi:MAG: glycosyltransferase family 4 protein [Verrucomicrobiota bacterium]|nr:glycosyltransferase family 4 protein [Verrucomicrobiota bacterium]